MEERLEHEIAHGKYLVEHGAGEVWNWESPAGKERWRRRVKMLTEFIQADSVVLELGCGTGYFTKEIIKTGAKVTAIDISPDLLAVAREQVRASNVTFMEENAYQMTFPDNYFDYIIGSSVSRAEAWWSHRFYRAEHDEPTNSDSKEYPLHQT